MYYDPVIQVKILLTKSKTLLNTVTWKIVSVFSPSSNFEGLQHYQQDWKIPRIYQGMELPSSDPENMYLVQDTFL